MIDETAECVRSHERMEQARIAADEGRVTDAIEAVLPLLDSTDVSVEVRLELIELMIVWYSMIGSFMECRGLAGRAVDLGTRAFGARDLRVLAARSSELYWMCEVGYDSLAEHRFAPLIREVKDALGTEHDLWWAVRTNSAMPAKAQGRFSEAAGIYRGILADMADHLPENDIRVLAVTDNYAEALFLAGQYEDAICAYSNVLDILEEEYGVADRHTLRVRDDIARARFASGDREEAISEWSGVVTDMEKCLGSCDELTASCRSLLIAAALETDKNDIAAQHCRALLDTTPSFFSSRDREVFSQILKDCEDRITVHSHREDRSENGD